MVSYAERRAGDNCDSVLELCQIWSVKLDGVDLRSSRCERQGRNRGYDPASNSEVVTKASVGTGLGSSVGETTVTTGCRLLEESSSVGAVSVEVRTSTIRTASMGMEECIKLAYGRYRVVRITYVLHAPQDWKAFHRTHQRIMTIEFMVRGALSVAFGLQPGSISAYRATVISCDSPGLYRCPHPRYAPASVP